MAVDHVAGLEGDRLEHGPGEVGPAGAAGDADDRAAGVRVPPRAAEAGEGRDDEHAAGVGHGGGQRGDLLGPLDDAEPVAQPLHGRAGDEDGALEGVGPGAVGQRPGDGGEQARRPARGSVSPTFMSTKQPVP